MTNGKRTSGWPIEQSTIRTGVALACIPGLILFGVWIGNELSTINTRLADALEDKFDRRDMAEWCAQARIENAGFNCTDPYALPSLYRSGRGLSNLLPGSNIQPGSLTLIRPHKP